MNSVKRLIAVMSAIIGAASVQPASAATIVLHDIGGVAGSPAQNGFRAAAKFWESQLLDPITIDLNVGFSSLAPGVLGSTVSTTLVTTVDNYYFTLFNSATSPLDVSAVTSLQPLSAAGGLTIIKPGYVDPATQAGADTSITIVDNDDSANNRFLSATTANLKALGFTLPPSVVSDGTVQFSSDFAFDFDPTDGIMAGTSDFIGVAIHEIGHALGFDSGVDTYDIVGCPGGPFCPAFSNTDLNVFAIGDVFDLFRYSAPGELNWSPGVDSYFSIDGGNSQLFGRSDLSTGAFNGDLYQASHWKANNTCTDFIGILNPYLCAGFGAQVTAADLAVFDAIGWDVRVDVLANPGFTYTSAQAFTDLPEPAVWLQLILGFGVIGGALRAARRGAIRAVALA